MKELRALALNSTLISLNVENNFISDERDYGVSLKYDPHVTESYAVTQICAEGAQALALNTTLTSLDIGGNIIRAEGAKALALNTTLTSLNVDHNFIDSEGARAFIETNTTLTRLRYDNEPTYCRDTSGT